MTLMDLTLAAHYRFSDLLGLELVAPLRTTSIEAGFLDENREPLTDTSIHHRNERLIGLADLQVTATTEITRFTKSHKTLIGLRLGLSLPTGGTEPNPFTLGNAGKEHQHMFFGSGTVDPLLGVDFVTQLPGVSLVGWVFGKGSLYENEHGYTGPTQINGAIGAQSNLGLKDIGVVLQQEWMHEWPAWWRDESGDATKARNSGRTDWIANLTAFWNATPSLTFNAALRIPYYTQSQGGQLSMPAIVSLGAQYTIPLEETDTASAPSTPTTSKPAAPNTGDIQDIARGGASFKLQDALVPGKITLIDFWAEWCEPCHVITHQLSQIAASHSNVAIRKVEVPDFEQPVFLEHLQGSPGLPAVWIFDETGTLVIKLAAVSPPKVLEELNKVLRCDDAHSEDEHDDQSEDQGDDHHHHH